MVTIKTERGIITLPKLLAHDHNTINGLCLHGVSLFDACHRCEPTYAPTTRSWEPGILGSCDCCGDDVSVASHLYKQPLGRGYYCEPCDERENASLMEDACLGGSRV